VHVTIGVASSRRSRRRRREIQVKAYVTAFTAAVLVFGAAGQASAKGEPAVESAELLLLQVPACEPEPGCVTTLPVTTLPETTLPETTAPETTLPATTAPATSVSESTAPETTAPETTVPGAGSAVSAGGGGGGASTLPETGTESSGALALLAGALVLAGGALALVSRRRHP
jgi:LPXTG-motif cell wall-anchored protein